jgi:TetR/AcrR family transcriptional regulator, cholesterol catabolism regulator
MPGASKPNGRKVFGRRAANRAGEPATQQGEEDVAMTSGNKQAEIVSAAIRLFQQKGYHATSMQDIADAVGLQKGSLYHYISSKEDLLVEIFNDAIAQYNARLSRIVAMKLPVRDRLELAIRYHIEGIAENLGVLTIFLRESYALNAQQQAKVALGTATYNEMFERLFTEGVATGEVRELDPRLAARTVLGACNWFYRWYRPDGRKSLDEIVPFMIDIIFHGIASRPQV